MATVRFAPVLRSSVGGSKQVNAQGSSLNEVLFNLYTRYPALKEQIQPEGKGPEPLHQCLCQRSGCTLFAGLRDNH